MWERRSGESGTSQAALEGQLYPAKAGRSDRVRLCVAALAQDRRPRSWKGEELRFWTLLPSVCFMVRDGQIGTFLVYIIRCYLFLPVGYTLGYKMLGVFIQKDSLCTSWCSSWGQLPP